jgi:CBS domain containing-hemolysin-like protein
VRVWVIGVLHWAPELHKAPNVFLSTMQIGITLIAVLLGA